MEDKLLGEWKVSKLGIDLHNYSLLALGAEKIKFNGATYYTLAINLYSYLVFDENMTAIGSIEQSVLDSKFREGDGLDFGGSNE